MTSIDSSSSSNNSNSAAASLENKLRATLHSYRQKRDEVHRGKQLAVERLRLATEECEAVQSAVRAAQTHLAALREKAGGSAAARQEDAALQRDVEHLTKEVHFQHTELVQKRTKLDAQKEASAKEAAQRQSSIRSLQGTVQTRRERLHELHQQQEGGGGDNRGTIINSSGVAAAVLHSKPPPGVFQLTLQQDGECHLRGRWMKILDQRTAALQAAATALRVQVEQKQRIRQRYAAIVAVVPPPNPPPPLAEPQPQPQPKALDGGETDDEASVGAAVGDGA